MENYENLWFIERAFRINKTDLRIRPIYHRLRNRIEGHICICFTAYTILLELERILKKAKSDITINKARKLVRNMYRLTYRLPATGRTGEIVLKDGQRAGGTSRSGAKVDQEIIGVSHCGKQEKSY